MKYVRSEMVSFDPDDYTNPEDALRAAEHYKGVGRLIDARRLELHAQRLEDEAAEVAYHAMTGE